MLHLATDSCVRGLYPATKRRSVRRPIVESRVASSRLIPICCKPIGKIRMCVGREDDSEKAVAVGKTTLDFPIDIPSAMRACSDQYQVHWRAYDKVIPDLSHHILRIAALNPVRFIIQTEGSRSEYAQFRREFVDERLRQALVAVIVGNEDVAFCR